MSGVNLVVVCGACSAPAETRIVASGRRLVRMSLRVESESGPATSVPVTVWDPAAWVEDLDAGDAVIVVGRVRRRFFALAAGGRGNRVDVEAVFVGRGGQRRPVAAALRRAEAALAVLSG